MMMKQTYKINVSKSYENPNFSKMKEQMIKQQPIQISNLICASKQQKPPTPQPQHKSSFIKIENKRPTSQGSIKPPLNSTSNRLQEKLPPKPDKSQEIRKSIKIVKQDIKEITFGKGQSIDMKQSFGKSFNKFNNGILLQSMKLSKEQIEQNNEYMNREMKEQDEEDDNSESEEQDIFKKKQTFVNKLAVSSKQNIENYKPLTPPAQQKKTIPQRPISYTPLPTKSKVVQQTINNPNQKTLQRPLSSKPLNRPVAPASIPVKYIVKSQSSQLQRNPTLQNTSTLQKTSSLQKTAKFKQF